MHHKSYMSHPFSITVPRIVGQITRLIILNRMEIVFYKNHSMNIMCSPELKRLIAVAISAEYNGTTSVPANVCEYHMNILM